MHRDKCLICMEGPAFSTRAESNMYRMLGGDIINMSVLPEAKLAMEAEIAYQMICMATDYDSWRVSEEVVTVETVIGNMKANTSNANQLAVKILPGLEAAFYENKVELQSVKALKGSMKFASITAKEARNPEAIRKLNYILPGKNFFFLYKYKNIIYKFETLYKYSYYWLFIIIIIIIYYILLIYFVN